MSGYSLAAAANDTPPPLHAAVAEAVLSAALAQELPGKHEQMLADLAVLLEEATDEAAVERGGWRYPLIFHYGLLTPLEHVHALCEPAQLATQPSELVAGAPLVLERHGRRGLWRRGLLRGWWRASSRRDGAAHHGPSQRWRHGVADGAQPGARAER